MSPEQWQSLLKPVSLFAEHILRQSTIRAFQPKPASCAYPTPTPTTWWEGLTPTTNQAARFVSLTQLVSSSKTMLSTNVLSLSLLLAERKKKSLLPPSTFFFLSSLTSHCFSYIQRIFPPRCCSTEGSSLCLYHSPDMFGFAWSQPPLTDSLSHLQHLCLALW